MTAGREGYFGVPIRISGKIEEGALDKELCEFRCRDKTVL